MNRSVALRAGYGFLLLSTPGVILGVGQEATQPWATPVARLLGARHLVQAAVLYAHPELSKVGGVLDLLHGLTDLGAASDPRLRRPALVDAGIAAGFCRGGMRSPG